MKFLIIDSNALLHRSFHALPPLVTREGEQTGAVYGFLLTLFKALNEIKPDFIVACFDTPAPTFRHEKYKEYKAKRPPAPEEFYQQIPKVKEVLSAFSIPIFEREGFEADDLIATISKKVSKTQVYPETEIYVVTGDLDTLQLVNKKTKVYTLGRGIKETIIYDRGKVIERFGIKPSQMVDFKALAGDPSDNIPGIPGVGKVTAAQLLKKFKNLDNLYQKIEKGEIPNIRSKLKENLLLNKEQAFFSRILAKAREDTPIDFDIKKCKFGKFDRKKIEENLKRLEFYSLLKRIPEVVNKIKNAGKIKEIKNNDGKLF